MAAPSVFRARLLRRLILVTTLTVPFACSTSVVLEDDDGAGGEGQGGFGDGGATTSDSGGSTSSGNNVTQCFEWPQPGTGSTGGGGIAVPPCPTMEEAWQFIGGSCIELRSEGTFMNGQCCYEAEELSCLVGRPYSCDGESLVALAIDNVDWSKRALTAADALTAEQRAILAAEWMQDGMYEHASIASFGRFAFELLAVGAPPELIDAAHAAARDEIRHAESCLSLARRYGESRGPGRFPVDGGIEVSSDLADIAARAAFEGCVGETVAAVQAQEQLSRAADPEVIEVLAAIAREEAAHAELAWRTVAWAIDRGGKPVRDAVAGAIAAAARAALRDVEHAHTEGHPALEAHGRLSAPAIREARRRAVEEVVMPCAERLLASPPRDQRARMGA